MQALRVLNVEDSERDAALLRRHLSRAGYDTDFERVETAEAMSAALDAKEWDLILTDYSVPGFGALQALALLKDSGRDIPVIVISGTIGEELAVEAMRAGAADYLMKGNLTRLAAAIERELEESRNRAQKRDAEAKLRESEERLRRYFQLGLIGSAITSPTKGILEANDKICELLGYEKAELLEKTWSELTHPEDLQVDLAHFHRVLSGEIDGYSIEKRFLRKNGQVVESKIAVRCVRDSDGAVAYFVAMLEDITAGKRAERALRDSEARYRQLFESNPEPIFVFHQETLELLAFNDAALHEYGYSREEFHSLSATAIWTTTEIPAFLQRLTEQPLGPPRGTTWKHRRKDGTIIDVEVTRHPFSFSGKPAWVMISKNVTEQKQLEEQFRQAQKMEAVGQLAGGMAHDFNNLLTVIVGYSDIGLARPETDSWLRNGLEQIKRAAERAAALTRQLLAFSRKQVLLLTVVDINRTISELQKMLHRLIGEDIDLRAELAKDLGNIKADRGQIEQVIMNLVVNARDAMPLGGTLTLETQNVELTDDFGRQHTDVNPGPYVMLAVTDTGTGMDAQTQERIFEPFFTTKESGKGTGLGLSTVYGIVRQIGGSIWVYSEVGIGTTFKIFFPRIDVEEQRAERNLAQSSSCQGTETILLTEDDEMVRSLAARVLSSYGYRVLEAGTGKAAIDLSEKTHGPIHILVTDIVMPGMTGRELSDRLRVARAGMKVLYMSGYTDKTIVLQHELDEKMSFLQKPFAPRSLAEKVREVLDQ